MSVVLSLLRCSSLASLAPATRVVLEQRLLSGLSSSSSDPHAPAGHSQHRSWLHNPTWPLPSQPCAGLATAARSQQASQQQSAAQEGLIIEPSASQRLKQLQARQADGKPVLLRIEVEGGGCSGYQYKFSLDHQTAESDKEFESDGVRVVCDPMSYELLRGSRVQFEDSLMRSAFVVAANPNSEASCGCGTSFAAKTVVRKKT